MPRQVRVEFPGAFYHVMARGNRLQPIFASPKGADRELFLKTLGHACERTSFCTPSKQGRYAQKGQQT